MVGLEPIDTRKVKMYRWLDQFSIWNELKYIDEKWVGAHKMSKLLWRVSWWQGCKGYSKSKISTCITRSDVHITTDQVGQIIESIVFRQWENKTRNKFTASLPAANISTSRNNHHIFLMYSNVCKNLLSCYKTMWIHSRPESSKLSIHNVKWQSADSNRTVQPMPKDILQSTYAISEDCRNQVHYCHWHI